MLLIYMQNLHFCVHIIKTLIFWTDSFCEYKMFPLFLQTVPKNFHDVLMHYTLQGYRVIGLACRSLKKLNFVKIQRAQREQMEKNLNFLGLLVMENRLKRETTPIIMELKMARIRPVMVTGQ